MSRNRNNVTILGSGAQTMVMAHGFGCDQNMWRFLTPYLVQDFRIVLFDYTGCGKAGTTRFNVQKYSTLNGYAQDMLDVCHDLGLQDSILISHSVSTMIGLVAALQDPTLFQSMAMVCPSPCFLNQPPDYLGGFDRADLDELLTMMDQNYIGWANYLAPVVMGTLNGPDLSAELSGSFCSTDPYIAKTFARATFLGDQRYLLPQARHPTLILQSANDALVSLAVGEYTQAHIPDSQLAVIDATGHCLHMTHPAQVAYLIRAFMAAQP